MRTLTLILLFALAPMFARAADITVTCDPPKTFVCVPTTTRTCPTTEGDPIPAGTVQTFKLWKPQPTTTDLPPSATPGQDTLLASDTKCSFPRTNLGAGTYWHYATVTIAGAESNPSLVTSITIAAPAPPKPNAPTNPKTTLIGAPTTAYSVIKSDQSLVLLPVGTVPPGTACDSTQGVVRGGNLYNVVDKAVVTYTGTARPLVVLAQCG